MNHEKGIITLFRFDPSVDDEPRYETYEVPYEVWFDRKVIDVLRYVQQNITPGLAFRESCYQGLCACCTIRMNNKPVLACEAIAEQEMKIEPLKKGQIIKDLVVITKLKGI
ncbi:MAG: 2Fe-2S iron-sulfur cluster-binding protein [Candidatus Hodarchaeota archaeon]